MATKYLDENGLLYFWQKIKNLFVTDVSYNSTSKKIQKTKAGSTSDVVTLSTVATSGSYTDLSDKPTIPEGVEKTSTTPLMDGTAAVGTETKFAAGDHVHPTDTSRAPTSHAATGTTYGKGTDSKYGHVKLSDATNGTAAASSGGTAATPKAVADALTAAKNYADGLDTGVSDVKIGETSIVTSGVATIPESSSSASGLMTSSQYSKLDGIAAGAEVNQNAFSNVKVGSTTVAADGKTDTIEFVEGSNVTLTPDATNDKITIAATDTTYSNATTSAAGLMSSDDKTKLNGIATGAEVNQNAFSTVKVGSTNVAADTKTDTLEFVAGTNVTITPDATNDKITIAATDTTYSNATTSAAGLMSSDDKTKLNGIASGAEVNQNAFSNVKVGSTTVAADGKTDTVEFVAGSNISITADDTNDKITIAGSYSTATTSADGLMSSSDKTKLNGIATGAEVKQNAFSNVKVGSSTVAADAKTDTLELIAGSNVTLTPDTTADTITIAATDTTYSAATTSADGLMSSSDKTKLNGIATGAEVNQNAFSTVKVGSTNVAADAKTDTLELAGSNVTLTPDATNDKVTIGITASNVTTALGNTAVARATGDASGNSISGTYAPKASPALTGTPTAPTATAGTNTTQIATTAFVTSAIQTAQVGAASFQGTAPTTFAPTSYKKGYYWVVGTAGTYVGETCEAGDMIFAIADYDSAYSAADFNVIQTNLDVTSIANAEIDTIVAS